MKQPLKFLLYLLVHIISLSSFAGKPTPLKPLTESPRADIKMLSSFLFASNGNIADGNRVVFDAQYSNAVDGNDAMKLVNPGENFGLIRNSSILAIEARQPIAAGDTLFYNMSGLLPQAYKLEIVTQYLAGTTVNCELVDRYLQTRSQVSFSDSNHYIIEITGDPESKAANRLMLVFGRPAIISPFKFTDITASLNTGKAVVINWRVNQEVALGQYDVERSADHINFSSLSTVPSLYSGQDGGMYQFVDMHPLQADNFYRIKLIGRNGLPLYSDEVKVAVVIYQAGMNVYPNPVSDHSFQVSLNDMAPGSYTIRLTNNSGQQVFTANVNIMSSHFTQIIRTGGNVSKGAYNVSVWNETGILRTERLIIQ